MSRQQQDPNEHKKQVERINRALACFNAELAAVETEENAMHEAARHATLCLEQQRLWCLTGSPAKTSCKT